MIARIPAPELDCLRLSLQRARLLAWRGHLSSGYTVLLRGLSPSEVAASRPWQQDLTQRWRLALEEYCHEFAVGEGGPFEEGRHEIWERR